MDDDGEAGDVIDAAVAAEKQLWQRFCVAGFPGKPQLLAQSVISGARSSVGSSFLSRCAMPPARGWVGGWVGCVALCTVARRGAARQGRGSLVAFS